MKTFRSQALALLVTVTSLLLLVSCGSSTSKPNHIPHTAFISHYEANTDKTKPFNVFWTDKKAPFIGDSVRNAHKPVKLYIKPVNLDYLVTNKLIVKYRKDIARFAVYFDKQIQTAFSRHAKSMPGLQLVDRPSRSAYTLEVALLSIIPSPITQHVLNDIIDVFGAPIGMVLNEVEHKGSMAMAARLKEPGGRIVMELADYRKDQSALLGLDIKDFELFGHHRRRVRIWSRELADTLTWPKNATVNGGPAVSLVPY